MSVSSTSTRSSVWRRTVYYFLIIVGIFFVSAAYMLYSAGYARTDSDMLVAVTRSDLQKKNHDLLAIKNRILQAGPNPAAAAVLDEELRKNGQRLEMIREIREMELTPKNAGNESRILEGLERNYAVLRAAWEHEEIGAIIQEQYLRFAVVLSLFFLSISLILYVLMKMILNPLESLIQGVRKVAEGDLEVSFQVGTRDELSELATVLGDLSTNFRELLTLMKSSSQNGMELTGQLEQILNASHSPETMDAEEAAAKAHELRILFQKIWEITDYFTFSGMHR